jgi:hypothetical protein
MNRRTVLIGLGGLFAGSGALLGTGAFTTVEAERTVTVETAGDADAFLGITPFPDSANADYVTAPEDGTVEIDITGESTSGKGVNENAITAIDRLLEVTNNGTQEVAVGFDAAYAEQRGDFSNSKYEHPYGWTYATNESKDAAVVLWASPKEDKVDNTYEELRPGLTTTGFSGSTLVNGNTIRDEVGETIPSDSDETRRVVNPGESLHIGAVVDTRASTVEEEPIPEQLDGTVSIFADAESSGG